MAVKWLAQPEDHDYEAAADYLSLIAEAHTVEATVTALKAAEPAFRKAKDILRAATSRSPDRDQRPRQG